LRKKPGSRRRGVSFEGYHLPGLQTTDAIATIDGHDSSTAATGERAAWFRDSECNLLGIGQPIT
jgi:hypothetical protein